MDPSQHIADINSAVTTLGQYSLTDLARYLALGILGSVGLQHMLEAFVPKVNPPYYIKVLLPSAIGSAIGACIKALGGDLATASQAAVGIAGLIHTINETPLAADLEAKAQALRDKLGKQ